MKLLRLALLCLAVATGSASAAVISLNTGTAAWTVTQTSGTDNGLGIGNTTGSVVLTGTLPFAANLPGFEAFSWANPFGGAVWVGQLPTDGTFTNGGSITCGSPCGAMAGFYTYSYSFDASLGGSMALNGFTGDNGVNSVNVVQANNGLLYSCTIGGPGTLCAATAHFITDPTGTLTLDAVAGGIVTVTAIVRNLDGPGRNPSGFILSGSTTLNDTVVNDVPEPSTMALLLAGTAILGLRARRRARGR